MKLKRDDKVFDITIIGGGPTGLLLLSMQACVNAA